MVQWQSSMELLQYRGGVATHVKIFSGNDPSRDKTCGESEFWHFKVKKTLPWSRESMCIEAKNAKMRFLRLFASIHRPSLNQGSVFSLLKCQIRIPRMFLPLERSFSEKIFENFFTWVAPSYCVVAPKFFICLKIFCAPDF
jgi:hypothetical protein